MPILDVNKSVSVANATATALDFEMPLNNQSPHGRNNNLYWAMNIHEVEFVTGADVVPATTVEFYWELLSKLSAAKAYEGKVNTDVKFCHREKPTHTNNINEGDLLEQRKQKRKIPYLNVQEKMYLNMKQGSGGAVTMGARIYYTMTEIGFKRYMSLLKDQNN